MYDIKQVHTRERICHLKLDSNVSYVRMFVLSTCIRALVLFRVYMFKSFFLPALCFSSVCKGSHVNSPGLVESFRVKFAKIQITEELLVAKEIKIIIILIGSGKIFSG